MTIGSRTVGSGHSVYLVAEIGINHNGDMGLARRTIDAAKAAGADSVKFQSYRTEDFVVDPALIHTYVSQGRRVTESQREMFQRYELGPGDLLELSRHCREIGIDFHATPTNVDGVRELVGLGCQVLKNGSDFLAHLPLVRAMGESGVATVLSTGMATLGDIADAVDAFRGTGNQQLVLLHCVSQYPAPIEELDLRRVASLSERFGCVSGFSDHSRGGLAAALSVAFGAAWIEKHFTLDQSLPGPDHEFSSSPEEFAALVRGVRDAESMIGTGDLGIGTETERRSRAQFTLSCAAAADLPAGAVLSVEQIAFLRPGGGFAPREVDRLVGRRLVQPVRRGARIEPCDLEDLEGG